MNHEKVIRFTLPHGYIDAEGRVHQEGTMRLATALDEIESVAHPRVVANEAYLAVILISRVVLQLGTLPEVTPQVVEQLYAADLAYLEDLYLRLNSHESVIVGAMCPHCDHQFNLRVAPLFTTTA
ncbi:MAG: phage tail assembly protein [Anaerolineae bacterium]|nr:phage tail assembly protein [Anaerolineae bacterium]